MAWTDSADQNALVEEVEFLAGRILATGQEIGGNREKIYIELERSARKLLRIASRPILYDSAVDGSTYANANLTGTAAKLVIPMPPGTSPAKFLRFLWLECDHLEAQIASLLDANTKEYRIQQNTYSRADKYDPKAFLVPIAGEPNYAIEVYPGTTDSNPVTVLLYVGETAPEDMPEQLRDAMIYDATVAILIQMRQPEAAGTLATQRDSHLSAVRVGLMGEEPAAA